MRVVARELICCLVTHLMCAAPHVPRWSWPSWRVVLYGVMGLVMASCQPRLSPTLPPSAAPEPRFLPPLSASQTRPGAGAVALSAEQQTAFRAAEALRTSGQPLQARQAFADFVRRYPNSDLTDDALLALGHISATLEQYEQALPYYRSLLERFPRSELVPEAQLGLGVALYHRRDYSNSLVALRQYLTLVPSGKSRGLARYYLGVVALKQQRYADAIPELQAAVETSGDPAVVQQARQHIVHTVREILTVDALVLLAQQYAKTSPGDLILERLAQEYRKRGNRTAEADALRRLTTAFPHTPDIQAAQARLQSLQALRTTEPRTTERSKIGVLLPLSGAGARAGTRALRGIELALAIAQERDPALQVSLAIRDSTQNAAAAQDALRDLVNEEHVLGVIGPLLSRTAIELAPLADQLSVPLISPYARDSDFPALSPYAMRNSLTDTMQGRFLAEYAIGVLKLQRFVILHPESPYGTALRDRFREQVLQRQGEIVAVLSYNPNSANISRVLGRLNGLQYDAIFLPEYADKVPVIVAQLAAQNIKGVQLLGTDAWNTPGLVAKDARLLESAIFVDGFFVSAPAPAVHTFVEQFRERYQETPDLLAAQAYDTLLMCVQVLKAGAHTPRQLRDGLLRVHDFDGVSGLTSMRSTRDAEKVLYLLTVKDGQIVQLNAAAPR
jgi:branched-chain amino acid transport system substrate-binding protein